MEKIIGKYFVCDCEHSGDMESAKSFIRNLGCQIVDDYWDGRDCGEAWIEFSFYDNIFVKVYEKLSGSSVSYSADINKYMKSGITLPYPLINGKELIEMKNRMADDCSKGFEERLPLWLFFQINEYRNQYSAGEIVEKVLSYFEEPVEVLG